MSAQHQAMLEDAADELESATGIARELWGDGGGWFSVHDPEPDNHHSPLYLVFPSGLMVNVSGDDTPGLDVARAHWIASVLNAAISTHPEPTDV